MVDAVDDEGKRKGKGKIEKGRKELHIEVDDSDDKVMVMMVIIRDGSNGNYDDGVDEEGESGS